MKNILTKKITRLTLILAMFSSMSCKNSEQQTANKIIPEAIMENILYDLTIIDAARISDPQSIKDAGLNQQNYIFSKYKIDSTQFVESNNFYSSNIDVFIAMYERIITRIDSEKTVLDTLIVKNNKRIDSLKNAIKDTQSFLIIQKKRNFFRTNTLGNFDSLKTKT